MNAPTAAPLDLADLRRRLAASLDRALDAESIGYSQTLALAIIADRLCALTATTDQCLDPREQDELYDSYRLDDEDVPF